MESKLVLNNSEAKKGKLEDSDLAKWIPLIVTKLKVELWKTLDPINGKQNLPIVALILSEHVK